MCLVLKELIDSYRLLNGSVFTCFLDASKSFDRVNHSLLFNKLCARGVPFYLIRLLVYWYEHQRMCVRWGGVYSSYLTVTNGVRQGGILSPYLFNVYVDDLSVKLYYSGGCINHLMYAEDLVIMSPSVAGLYKLLHICESFGLSHDVLFNNKKSTIMSFRAGNLKDAHLPLYTLNGEVLCDSACVKYLGHFICSDLTDDTDMLREFHMCSIGVRLALFRSFCSPMYTSQIWWNYKKCNMKLITYHNVFKMSILCQNMKGPVYYVLFIICSVVRLSSEILCIV